MASTTQSLSSDYVKIGLYWKGESNIDDGEIECLDIEMVNRQKKVEFHTKIFEDQKTEQQIKLYLYEETEKNGYKGTRKKKFKSIRCKIDAAKTLQICARVLQTYKDESKGTLYPNGEIKYDLRLKSKNISVSIEEPNFMGGKQYKLVVFKDSGDNLKGQFHRLD